MEKRILLVPSDSMDGNKKEDRNEHVLLRASKKVRDNLNLDEGKNTKIFSSNSEKNVNLAPFHAFSKDIKKAKSMCKDGLIKEEDLENVCFISSTVFDKLAPNDAKVYEAVLNKMYDSMLIGTDPELLIMQNDNVVDAGNIPGFSKHSQFGCDGAMAELRPDPSHTPEGLVDNIRSLLTNEDLTQHIQKYDWKSACYFENDKRDFPVGTHLHFDNPAQIKQIGTDRRMRLFAVTNRILDELLTIPMIRLDGPKGHNRRAKCKMSQAQGFGNVYGVGYGFFGEWRPCEGRLEHRSLSGLTISNPDICRDVFGVGQAIVESIYKEVINNGLDDNFILPAKYTQKGIYRKTFKSWGKIPLAETFDCTNSSEFMRTIMDNSSRVEIDKTYIDKWLAKIRNLSTYGKYEKYVESLGDLLRCSAKVLDKVDKNIKQNWGV